MVYQRIKIHDAHGKPRVSFDRAATLVAVVKDKTVLHVGCTDCPMTAERIRSNQLLHSKLQTTARAVLGIDIDEKAIAEMRAAGFDNVIVNDGETMAYRNEFDIILAGDVMEHMNNPGQFLANAYRALKPAGLLVIGVPSALTFAHLKAWLLGREDVHRDHVAYYSPKTLAELARRFGFVAERLTFTVQPPDGEGLMFQMVRNLLIRLRPQIAPSMIMHFRREEDRAHDERFYYWD